VGRETDAAAAAVRSYVERAIAQVLQADYGIVRQVDPLQVELGHTNFVLDSDELVVTQEVRRYDATTGLQVGDALGLMPMESGEYLAVGVVSNESDPEAAVDPSGGGAWSPGDLKPTAADVTVVPSMWLLCDGSVRLTSAYPELYAAIGDEFNTGGEVLSPPAAREFRLPDGRGRMLIGAAFPAAGTAPDASSHRRGQPPFVSGGTETVTLALTQIPAHAHTGATANAATGIAIQNESAHTHAGAAHTHTMAHTHTLSAHVHAMGAHTHTAGSYATSDTMPTGWGGSGTTPSRVSQDANAGTGASTGTLAFPLTVAGTSGGMSAAANTGAPSSDVTGASSAANTGGATAANTGAGSAHTHAVTDTGHTHTITSEGGGLAHSNMPPHFVGNWLIFAGR
jgi:microcystin-dependent protein